jgi:eukaryotic-like serine/threonine-protein kinase
MPDSVSSHLGPYEIVSRLGVGGMGEVWLARDPRLNRDVAIKKSAQQFNHRFEGEAKAIAALNHPNICTLYDVGPDYLVMELVEGPTLDERMAEGPIPLDEALGIASQIADALEAAHEKGLVHRDLKPGEYQDPAGWFGEGPGFRTGEAGPCQNGRLFRRPALTSSPIQKRESAWG